MRHASKVAALKPELDAAWAAAQKSMKGQGRQQVMVEYAKQARTIFKDAKCNPFKSFAIALVQIPVFITMVLSVRQMVNSGRYPSMKEGGLFWFEDLTLCDNSYALPAINLSLMVLNLQMAFGKASGGFFKYLHRGLLLLLAATFPIVSQFPSGVFIYWIANSSFSLIQGFVVRRPAVQKLLRAGIPPPGPRLVPAGSRGLQGAGPLATPATSSPPPAEMLQIRDIIETYQERNQARSEVDKHNPQMIAAEVRAALAEERQKGVITTPLAVMIREDPEGEPQVVVAVVSDKEELDYIMGVIDKLISKHGTAEEPDEVMCQAINETLKEQFEKGLITVPAQVSLSHDVQGKAQLEVDLGLGGPKTTPNAEAASPGPSAYDKLT